MIRRIKFFRLFGIALGMTASIIAAKWLLHYIDVEPIVQTSLQNSVVSSVIFVIGFLLSATIADYKESEKIPSDFASIVENMYEDARYLHTTYPAFKLDAFRKTLVKILDNFREGTRSKRQDARRNISQLNTTFLEMEAANVPPNFIVKLKQQQAQLLRSMYRVNYIQKITFIPSATILARSIVILVITMLLFTNIDPFYGGLVVTGIISFIMIYMLLLIKVISVPFHEAGKTQDDVSLFLLTEAKKHLNSSHNL